MDTQPVTNPADEALRTAAMSVFLALSDPALSNVDAARAAVWAAFPHFEAIGQERFIALYNRLRPLIS